MMKLKIENVDGEMESNIKNGSDVFSGQSADLKDDKASSEEEPLKISNEQRQIHYIFRE
jgi:hypothetical protein